MASNSFGSIFKITTWGESHGKGVGVVIDGCPSGLEMSEEEINRELALRVPGRNNYVSPRKELDQVEVLSGIFEGKTTGAPICLFIRNKDSDPSKYESIKHLLRPGHANYTYLQKYGIFDYRGGGRSSARETAARVAAGAVAKKILAQEGIQVIAYLKQMGGVKAELDSFESVEERILQSPLFCPDKRAESAMSALLDQLKNEGDSIGGIVEFAAFPMPIGLGDPIYEKLEARLAFAMMGLPAGKGFEIGSGFESALMYGSLHNDAFIKSGYQIQTKTNYSGGVLGGISNGMPLIGRVVFKPASSIKKTQETVTVEGESATFSLPEGSRHDPCVAIRAVPVVSAMTALVLVDAILLNRSVKK